MIGVRLANAIVVMLCGLLAAPGQAQSPEPSAALKTLEVFVGSWTFEWDAKPSILGPGGKITGVERFEWLPGGLFLQMTREAKGPRAEFRNLEIFGYDATLKAYTQIIFNLSTGWSGSFSGTQHGSIWSWSASGTGARQRCVWTLAASGASRTMKCELSTDDGKTWTITEEGMYTKSTQ